MTDDADFIRAFMLIKRELIEAQEAVLKKHGHTWTSVNDLEWKAERMMDSDTVSNELGTLFKKATPYWIEKSMAPSGYRTELRFSKNKKEESSNG